MTSRGISPSELANNVLWFKGPEFLHEDEANWPKTEIEYVPGERIEKFNPQPFHEMCLSSIEKAQLIEHNRFSKINKLKTTLIFVFRALKQICLKKENINIKNEFLLKLKETMANSQVIIKPEEMKLAEIFLLKEAQKLHPPSEDTKQNLLLFKDSENLWRSKGRIELGNLDEETKFPIWLPKNAIVTELIIREVHEKMAHAGTNTILACLRLKYWISRKKVQDVTKKCQICKKFWIKSYAQPEFPTLPAVRVNQFRPFMHTAVDYFGPLIVKQTNGEKIKRWIAVYTCTSTRAIHLEIAEDLSAQAFLQTFRRFMSQRKKPVLMISDNGTNFKAAEKTLQMIWKEVKIQKFSSDHEIKWIFVTERAPWKNGLVERMVGLVKYSLKRTVGKRLLEEEEFRTLISEVQNVVNSRPLNFIPDSEHIIPLRPVDFLIPYEEGNSEFPHLPKADLEDPDYRPQKMTTKEELVEEIRKASDRINKFWEIWTAEYLLALRERKNNIKKCPSAENPPKVGDIVIIRDEETKNRGVWKLGKIEKLLPGERTAVVKTGRGTTRRAVNDLFPFEVDENEKIIPEKSEENENENKNNSLKLKNKNRKITNKEICQCNLIIFREMEDEHVSDLSLDYEEEKLKNQSNGSIDKDEEPPKKQVKQNFDDRLQSFVKKIQKQKESENKMIRKQPGSGLINLNKTKQRNCFEGKNQEGTSTSRLMKFQQQNCSEPKNEVKKAEAKGKDLSKREVKNGKLVLNFGWALINGCLPGANSHKRCSQLTLSNVVDIARKDSEEVKRNYPRLQNKPVQSLIQLLLCFFTLMKMRKDWWKKKNNKTTSFEAGIEFIDEVLNAKKPAQIITAIEKKRSINLERGWHPRDLKPALALWKAACELAEEAFSNKPWLPISLRGQENPTEEESYGLFLKIAEHVEKSAHIYENC
uniref:Integrase catalytic domain-containing protein n=1 Tax=Meloidogyne enterolobii TaxID=390850 RepID=A0A6V7XN17_MELEN|nr:unnamed protein product [Meloidogyne enterolobii]